MANNFVHGKLSTVQLGGTYFAIMNGSYEETLSDLSDITYSLPTGGAYKVLLPGYNGAKGDLTYTYDTLNQPTVSGNLLQTPGTLMTVIISPDNTKFFSFSAYSASLGWQGAPQAKGPVVTKTSYETTGTITRPAS